MNCHAGPRALDARRLAPYRRAYRNLRVTLLFVGGVLAPSGLAWAQADPPLGSPAPAPSAPGPDGSEPSLPDDAQAAAARVEAAAAAFDRALGLEDQGNLAAALVEYVRAYALLPNYDVLYNIGSVNLELQRLGPARRAFEQYLKLGGPSISAEQGASVRNTVERLKRQTATLSLALNVAPSEVSIDSVPLETLDFSGVVLDAGEHVVRVQKPGFVPLEKSVSLASGDRLQLIVQLMPIDAAGVRSENQPEGALQIPSPPVTGERQDSPPSEPPRLWIPWTVTGGLAVGWATTAALALKARHDRDIIEARNASPERLEEARRLHITLAVVSDVLLASTLAAAGVSAYLTWWPSDSSAGAGATPSLLGLDSRGVWTASVSGTF